MSQQIQEHMDHVLKPLDDLQACDTVGIICVSVLILLALAVCFSGYRIYKLAFTVFAFLVGFGIQAAIGSAWIAEGSSTGVTEKVIVLVCSILWGTLFLVLARRYRETIEQIVGFVFGICLGLAITVAVLYVLQRPLDSALGSKYQGWEKYAGITLGVPIALATGYMCRNWVKFLVMLVTAFVGAAAAWRWGSALLGCSNVNPELLKNPYFQTAIVIGLGVLGLVVQFCFQPRKSVVKSSAPAGAVGEP